MNMRNIGAFAAGCALFCAVLTHASRTQGRDAAGHSSSSQSSGGLRPTNLQVLPKDTSEADAVLLMVRYGQELGVQCAFCHVENPQTQQVDFVSDENPRKQTARIMIGMVSDINSKYLAQVGDRRYAVPISCGNCHQGQTFPPSYQPKPQ
jgi:Photosynthetic reaction centre cytochrome C subunit